MKRDFTLEYWMDKGWFVGRLKEAPGVFSQGETMDELVHNIDEVCHLLPGAPKESLDIATLFLNHRQSTID